MSLIVLNGPTGTGKNTISDIVAQCRERCAVIDYDDLRNVFRKPHLTPWGGEAGRRQNVLGLEHACGLARKFVDNWYNCIFHEMLSDEPATLYKGLPFELDPMLIHLLPKREAIVQRTNEDDFCCLPATQRVGVK